MNPVFINQQTRPVHIIANSFKNYAKSKFNKSFLTRHKSLAVQQLKLNGHHRHGRMLGRGQGNRPQGNTTQSIE